MKCGKCNGPEVVDATTTIEDWRGDDLRIIRDVPCERCPQCGEEYFAPAVMRELERILGSADAPTETISAGVFRFCQQLEPAAARG